MSQKRERVKSRSPKKPLFLLLVLTILWPVIVSSPAHATERIMPLGDSITDGYIDAITDPEYRVGYRQKLYLDLKALGYDVDFIGSQQSGQFTPPPFDYDHEGHPGWNANEIADNIYSWLIINPANIVLLHIGTNYLTIYPGYIEDILDEIDAYSEDITVILSRIINRMNYSPKTTEFNNNVLAMVKNRIANGDKIILVDHENSLTYPDDMQDDLHPNMDGYNKMAQVWLRAMVESLPLSSISAPIITTIPSTKATINIPYSYNVNAASNPAAQYSLLSSPTGMTIDSNTGSITWTPTTLGDFPVSIKATNGQTPDAIQNFTVNVLELPLNDINLISGQRMSDFIFQGGWAYYKIDTDASDAELKVELENLSNDVDLYVRMGDRPDDGSYDCRPYLGDTKTETCILPNSGANTWFIGVNGYKQGFFTIHPTLFDAQGNITLASGQSQSGSVLQGEWAYYKISTSSLDTQVEVALTELSNDVDLYVRNGAPPTLSSYDCRPYLGGTDSEICTLANSGANTWYIGVNGYQSGSFKITATLTTEGVTAPTITSTPVTDGIVGQLYSYDVDATGNPVPTYVLTTSPSGMTIDTATGLIQWTPSVAGNFDVTVEASNSAGTDSQPFTIAVTEGVIPIPLVSGQGQSGSVLQGEWVYYKISTSSLDTQIEVALTGLSNDVDLYVRNGALPTLTDYDCRPYLGGTNSETCTLANSGTNTWHIGVYGYRTGNFTVKATLFDAQGNITLVSGQSQSGSVLQGEWAYYKISTSSLDTQIEVALTELSNDVDLYVRNGALPTLSSYDCRPYLGGTDSEICTLANSGANTWYIGVNGYQSGSFKITATLN